VARGPEARAELTQAAELGLTVEGTVTAVNKGGVEVTVAGVRGFCPISQLDIRHVPDAAEFVGHKYQFRVTRYDVDRRGANLVVSRRALLEEEARGRAEKIRSKLVVGAVLPGVVSTIKDFGAFVDLGGIEGMLHVSELGHSRTTRPGDVLAVGQRLDVQILRIEKTDDPKRPEGFRFRSSPWRAIPGKTCARNFLREPRSRAKSCASNRSARSSNWRPAWKDWCTRPSLVRASRFVTPARSARLATP
jgi:predicted RNA-binding protein with RPS1 domain